MSPSAIWPFHGPRAGLAFSERFLVTVGNGDAHGITELPEQLLEPSPSVPNISSVAELARLVTEALSEVGRARAQVVVALPDLALTSVVLDAPGRLGGTELLRRLSSRLSYPVTEARTDFWRCGDDVLGAAVREAVIRQYETAISAADCRIGWVDGCSTARIPQWAASTPADDRVRVRVQLYRSHYAIVGMRGRKLLDLRTKLRSPGDSESVAAELRRLPDVYAIARLDELSLSGEDASKTAAALEGEAEAMGRVHRAEEGEPLQLAASLRALLARSSKPVR